MVSSLIFTSSHAGRLSFRVQSALEAICGPEILPVISARCRDDGLDPDRLVPIGLHFILSELARDVARLQGLDAGLAARRALVLLLHEVTTDPSCDSIRVDSAKCSG